MRHDLVWWWLMPRIVNGTLALFAMAVLLCRFPAWLAANRVIRVYWLALFALLLSAAEGSIEQLIQHVPPGPRTVLLTVALVWAAYAAARSVYPHPEDRAQQK